MDGYLEIEFIAPIYTTDAMNITGHRLLGQKGYQHIVNGVCVEILDTNGVPYSSEDNYEYRLVNGMNFVQPGFVKTTKDNI